NSARAKSLGWLDSRGALQSPASSRTKRYAKKLWRREALATCYALTRLPATLRWRPRKGPRTTDAPTFRPRTSTLRRKVWLLNWAARPEGGAWMKPLPGAGVVNCAPRVLRNPLNGVPEIVVAWPPPSQLISRRPVVSGPAVMPLLGSPSAARKASTVDWIDAASEPDAWKTNGAAFAVTGSVITSNTEMVRQQA